MNKILICVHQNEVTNEEMDMVKIHVKLLSLCKFFDKLIWGRSIIFS